MHNLLTLGATHLDLLYEQDDRGLLLCSRGRTTPTPMFHLVRTIEGNRWLIASDVSQERRVDLQKALEKEPVIARVNGFENNPPILTYTRSAPAQDAKEYRGPIFLFPDVLPPAKGKAEILRDSSTVVTVPELDWIRTTYVTPDKHPLAVARNSSGEVVSICHSSRSTVEAAAAGVETAREYRGQGLAGEIVLAWAKAVRAQGRVPIYSTQWTNHASRAVARKLGLIIWGEDYHVI